MANQKHNATDPSGSVVFIDFETRAVRDLLKVGAYSYTLCPEFDVLCLSMAVDNKPVQNFDGPKFHNPSMPGGLNNNKIHRLAKDPKVIWEAHYVSFEFWVWHNYMVPKYKFPPIPIERWRCSAAAAASKGFPRALGELCKAIDAEVQKDMDGKKLMLKMCKPLPEVQRKKNNGEKWFWNPEAQERLKLYCGDDVDSERAAGKIIGQLSPAEQEVWVEDQKINHRGVTFDMDLAVAGENMAAALKDTWAARSKKRYGFSPSQVQKVKDYLEANGVVIPLKLDKKDGVMKKSLGGQVIKKLIISEKPGATRDLLILRKDFASTSLAKYKNVSKMAVGDVCRDMFMMNGANTGRWSSKGVQLHNNPRGNLSEDNAEMDMEFMCNAIKENRPDDLLWCGTEMDGMKSAIRGLIVAPMGMRLYVMDYSQIEARIMAWLADQEHVLQAFRDGKDLYKITAALMDNIKYEDVTKEQRFLGKVGSLSLQYQGGEDAFMGMATNYGKVIERKQAKKVKLLWREANPEITELWSAYNWAAIKAIRHGSTQRVGRIAFRVQGDFLLCKLPSGRCLHYYKPKVKMVTVRPKKNQDFEAFDTWQMTYMGSDTGKGVYWARVGMYGGRWAENICQAIGADILRVPVVNIPKTPSDELDVVFHVHDEIGAIGPDDDFVDVRLDAMKHTMLDVPDCYEGLPMAAEGFSGYRYRKD